MNSGISVLAKTASLMMSQLRHHYIVSRECWLDILQFFQSRIVRMIHAKNYEELSKFVEFMAKIPKYYGYFFQDTVYSFTQQFIIFCSFQSVQCAVHLLTCCSAICHRKSLRNCSRWRMRNSIVFQSGNEMMRRWESVCGAVMRRVVPVWLVFNSL